MDDERTRTSWEETVTGKGSFNGASLAAVFLAVFVAWVGVSCGGSKKIHRYQPRSLEKKIKASPSGSTSDVVLAVENFSAGAGYDEQRIVYRESEYRFDYYHFHRWAAPPGMLVADVLREVYRQTGRFRAVVSGYAARADVVLTGRVIAFEELDKKKDTWLANVVLDLRLRDAQTGELIWSDTVQKQNKLKEQSPGGLAHSLSVTLTEIGIQTTDAIVSAGTRMKQRREREKRERSSGGDMFEGDDKSEADRSEE